MGINFHKMKKWTNMILGKSSYHVNQNEGMFYSKTEVKGYYNNLTEKITRFGKPSVLVPKTIVDTGKEIFFPIAIFQYGLAAYDLYLSNSSDAMKNIVIACAKWAVENLDNQGRWDTFSYNHTDMPYSSMAQGEGISLLIRAKHLLKTDCYDSFIHRAFEYMIKPIENGGTAKYKDNRIYFYESPMFPLVLNGWIFSIWGIWDYVKEFKDANAEEILDKTLKALEASLPEYDIGYWSKYDDGKMLASPFYHSLHIAQLNVMFDLTGKEVYKVYKDRWLKYKNNFFFSKKAFVKKALQKVME